MVLRILIVLVVVSGALFATSGVSIAQTGATTIVAARDLPRGATLTAEDIRPADAGEVAGSGQPPAAGDVGPGWVTRRVIAEGEPLRTPAVGPPLVVRNGETVVVVSRHGGIELRISGRAMGAAAEGERVTVRIDSRRRLEGVAVGPGLVHINGAHW